MSTLPLPLPSAESCPANGAAVHVVPVWHATPVSGRSANAPAQGLMNLAGIADWDILFNAVQARLRMCVGAPTGSAEGVLLRTQVLECVTAMEQLQQARQLERGRVEQLEREVIEVRLALAEAHTDAQAELRGTRASERQARHLSLHDSLTLLPNRSYFRERLEHALLHLSPTEPMLALLYLDLDGFKAINDSHGHEVGDELLRIMATRLNHLVRSEDMVSRLGGDEFACLLAGAADRPQLAHLATKLYDAVAAPLRIGVLRLSVRASIGIAIFPQDGEDAVALLKSANLAMYCAKREQTRYAFAPMAALPPND